MDREGLREWIVDSTPPAFVRRYRAWRSRGEWSSPYPDWDSAAADCVGYEDPAILERVKRAALRVRAGEGAFERDSVVFEKPAYNWPLLAVVSHVAASHGALRVIDFGGSLGSTYQQHRSWLDPLGRVHWGVVEQPAFVRCGRDLFEDERLKFYESISACSDAGGGDLILFSSVLQYLRDPWWPLDEAVRLSVGHIVVDRTGFVTSGSERVVVQKVSPELYPASYPCRFFTQQEIERRLSPLYSLVAAFDAIDRPTPFARFRGLYFRRQGMA